jgi:hypothetical protein
MKAMDDIVEACTCDLSMQFESGDLLILDEHWDKFQKKLRERIAQIAKDLRGDEEEAEGAG